MRMRANWQGEPLVRCAIRFDDDGFSVEQSRVGEMESRTTIARWADIERVKAFKRDLITIDDLCVAFTLADDTSITLSEYVAGFADLLGVLPQHLPGCPAPQLWWAKVAHPAFATNHIVLWDRISGREPLEPRLG